ncbi:MAG: hypothetical protein KDJ65_09590 [Anaerolineae bacterium]|nr:hypothetical protein [Anaerolineae bacterium]
MRTKKLKYLLFMMIGLALAGFMREARIAKAASQSFMENDPYATKSAVSNEGSMKIKSDADLKFDTPSSHHEGSFVFSASITVTKVAVPASVPETGGVVTFTVSVTSSNASPQLDSLEDSEFGDLENEGYCTLPLNPFSSTYMCQFTETLAGSSETAHQNTVTATVSSLGPTEMGTDTATVNFTNVNPAITVKKDNDANGDAVFTDNEQSPEGGVSVPFKVTITNNTAEDVTIDEIIDDTYNLMASDCADKEGTVLTGSETITCTFSGTIPDDDDITETNTVTVTVSDNEDNSVSASDTSTVTTYDVQPNVTVSKSASPTSVPEPGGNVTFTFSVTNNSTETVTLNSLMDSDFDNLNGEGTCNTGGSIQSGAMYICQYTTFISGNFAGPSHQNTVTAVVGDDDGNTDNDTDNASVSFTNVGSSIDVRKTANPTSVNEPGANVIFTVVATNTSSVDNVTIDSVSDNKFGLIDSSDCVPTLPANLAPNEKVTCTFIEFVSGDGGDTHTNTVTVSGTDDDNQDVEDSDSASVQITNVDSTINVSLSANPTSVPEPGGSVNFTVTINNLSSADDVAITSLSDDLIGNLDGIGSCSTPIPITKSSQYQCTYSAAVNGSPGQIKLNTVTAAGTDDDDEPISDSDFATITITNVPSSISVTKTANPTSLPEPGGAVNFTVKVKNTSAVDTVTLNSLTDNLFGNLNGQGNCSTPKTIAPGNQYQCSFTGNVSGTAGQSKTSTTTAVAKDDDNVTLNKSGSATVLIGAKDKSYVYIPYLTQPAPVLLSIQNDKTGGNVTFTVIGTGVSCTVPNNQTQFCGSFPPGSYSVKAVSSCGTATIQKTYGSGAQTTRIFCQ